MYLWSKLDINVWYGNPSETRRTLNRASFRGEKGIHTSRRHDVRVFANNTIESKRRPVSHSTPGLSKRGRGHGGPRQKSLST